MSLLMLLLHLMMIVMSCWKQNFKSQLSSKKMYEVRVLMEEVQTDSPLILRGVVNYNQAVFVEEYLFSNVIAQKAIKLSVLKLILFVLIRLSVNCIFLSLPLLFLSPRLLHSESSSVGPDMQVRHYLFFFRWGVRVDMWVCLSAVFQCGGVSDVKMLEEILHLFVESEGRCDVLFS